MAATIISSIVAEQSQQSDGRLWVREIHTDSVGVLYFVIYLAPNATGIAAQLAANAVLVLAYAAQAEIGANINGVTTLGSLFAPTFVYSSVAVNVAALRAAYSSSTQFQAIMIGDFLSTLTDGQLQTAFGLTAGQVATLRTNKLTPASNLASNIRAAAGQ